MTEIIYYLSTEGYIKADIVQVSNVENIIWKNRKQIVPLHKLANMQEYHFNIETIEGTIYNDFWVDSFNLHEAIRECLLIFKFQYRTEIKSISFTHTK